MTEQIKGFAVEFWDRQSQTWIVKRLFEEIYEEEAKRLADRMMEQDKGVRAQVSPLGYLAPPPRHHGA